MSETQYVVRRRWLIAIFVSRVLCAIGIIAIWPDLEVMQKVLAIAVAMVVVPGLGSVKKLFARDARTLREVEPKSGKDP